MENTGTSLKPSKARTTLLVLSAGFSGVLFGLGLMYVSRIGALIGYGGAIGVILGSALFAAVLMPVMYFAINRFGIGLWGRYHFALALVTIVTSLCLVLCYDIGEELHTAGKIVTLCVCMPLSILGLMSLQYIFFSVNVRILGEERGGFKLMSLSFIVGLVVSAMICLLPVFGLGEGSPGYGIGCLVLLSGCVFYFSSVRFLPRFARPLPAKVTMQSIKELFLKKPSSRLVFACVAYGATIAAAGLMLGFLPRLTDGFMQAEYVPQITALAAVAAGFISFALAHMIRPRTMVSVIGATASVIGAAALAVPPIVIPETGYILSLTVGIAYAVIGVGIGLSLSALKIMLKDFVSDKQGGVRYCLGAMLICVSLGIGGALSALCSLFSPRIGMIVLPAVCAVLSIATLTLSSLLYVKLSKGKTKI